MTTMDDDDDDYGDDVDNNQLKNNSFLSIFNWIIK